MHFSILFLIFASTSARYTLLQAGNFTISADVSRKPNPDGKFQLTLNVDLPAAWFHYEKPLDAKAGGSFSLSTPMESYQYQSYGKMNLRCVNIRYFVESTFNPNKMCFALYFLSTKALEEDKHTQIMAHHNNFTSHVKNVSHPRIQLSPRKQNLKQGETIPGKHSSKSVKSYKSYVQKVQQRSKFSHAYE